MFHINRTSYRRINSARKDAVWAGMGKGEGGSRPRREDANGLQRTQRGGVYLASLAGRAADRRPGVGLVDDRPDGGDATPAI